MLADALAEKQNVNAALVVRELASDTDAFRYGHVRHADEEPEFSTFLTEPKVVRLNLSKRIIERFRFGEAPEE